MLFNRRIIASVLAITFVTGFSSTPASADPGLQADSSALAGYSKSTSVLPGGVVELAVRSMNSWTTSISRVGNYAGGQKVVFDAGSRPAIFQPDCLLSNDGANTI